MSSQQTFTFRTFFLGLWVVVFIASPGAATPGNDLALWLRQADSLRQAGEYKSARRQYEKILKKDRQSVEALRGLGLIAFQQQKWGDCKDAFKKILKIDPGNLEAQYYLGQSYRETGKFKAMLMRKRDWDKSARYCEAVLASDSLFRDVLHQYALLKRYRGKYEDAIRLTHAQMRLRPELKEPAVGIFRLYRYYITHRNLEEAVQWLKQQPWDYARFFIGEKLRREGKLAEARQTLVHLLRDSLQMPRQPIYLALARIYYTQNNPALGEGYFWRAVNEISNDVEADLVFQDIKYIVTDQELEQYRALKTIPDKINFFHTFWIRRDPTPAASTNVRLAEHYRRLVYVEKYYEYDGFRTWFASPDQLNRLKYPKSFYLNHEFNDKGLIYLRLGKPDERIATQGDGVPINESWLYYATRDNPRLEFHFLLGKSGSDWRLSPLLEDPRLLEDRISWGDEYYRLLQADELERFDYEQELLDKTVKSVEVGLSIDRHTWKKGMKPLNVPVTLATFRGEKGKTVLELAYAIPVNSLRRGQGAVQGDILFERGVAIYDREYHPVSKKRDVFPVRNRNSAYFIDLYRFTLPPDSYHVAFHVRPLGLNLLSGINLLTDVPDYSTSQLKMSDLLLAVQVEPATKKGRFVRNGMQIIPNPSSAFSREKPFYVYFEVYNLQQDEEGRTDFTVEYSLVSEKKSGGVKRLFGLLGGSKNSISISTDRQGREKDSREYVALNTSHLEPGIYRLTVKVTDSRSGETVERKQRLKLY